MPVYDFEALDKAGRKVRGTIEMESEGRVAEKLREMGYYPQSVNPSRRKTAGGGASARSARSGKPFLLVKPVRHPWGKPEALILHSRQIGIRWGAFLALLFSTLFFGALYNGAHKPDEKPALILLASGALVFGLLLRNSERRARIDRAGGKLYLKHGLPNGSMFQRRQTFELSRFRAVLLAAETSSIRTRVNRVSMNYVGAVTLIGPRDCVKIFAYHASDEKAKWVARDAAAQVARLLGLPMADESGLYGILEAPGEVAPQERETAGFDGRLWIALTEASRTGRIMGTVTIQADARTLDCQALFVQVIERTCKWSGLGHLRKALWTGQIREGAEIPLEAEIPAGEQRFIGFDLPEPAGFGPAEKDHVWQIAARLVAPGSIVPPVGLEYGSEAGGAARASAE